MSTVKTIKLTQAQLNMLRMALREFAIGFYEMLEEGGEDKRRIKTLEAIQKKLWE